VDNDAVTNDFGYNVRSEVIGALMGTNIYRYAYDPIGNRLAATNNAEGWAYLSKPLNQYTNIADGAILEPEYDADGNMTATGDGWRYVWNGENRMILASNDTTVVTYAYDHQGRMVAKTVDGSSRQYFWDGYNIVADAREACTNWFVWGMDLSGSLQGAGGVGGLLAEIQDGEPYFAAYDANGNVTEYISTNGMTAAHYEYSPFGEIVVQSGELADSFTHRFSTKPWCGVTGLSEYLFRKYEPGIGRWTARDPIGERGGRNLYGYVGNAPLGRHDRLGLSWLICDKCEEGRIRNAGPDGYTLVSSAYPGFPNSIDSANSALARSELLNHIMKFANVAAGVALEEFAAEVATAIADWVIEAGMTWEWTADMLSEVESIKKKLGDVTGINIAVKVKWQKCGTMFMAGLKGLTTRLDWKDETEWYIYEAPPAYDSTLLPGSFDPNDTAAIMKDLPSAFVQAVREVVK
jgi:RHS repeat-associated protein